MTAAKTVRGRSAKVSDSDRQAFDFRREQLREHLPDPRKCWRWSRLQRRIDQKVLQRARQKGYIEELTGTYGWRREEEPGWWRTTPEFYRWAKDRYGLDDEQGVGVEMLANPDEVGKAQSNCEPVYSTHRDWDGQQTLTGKDATETLEKMDARQDLRRREQCASHTSRSNPAHEIEQLSLPLALELAKKRSRWSKNGKKLVRPRGNTYTQSTPPVQV